MLWLLKVSIFCSAIIWNWNSYPALRAGSPQQVSASPNTAKSTPAAFSTLVMARVASTLRSIRAPVQPTQNRVLALSPSANILSSRPLVQSPLNLSDCTPAHGCPLDCIFPSISWALSGILLCVSTRFRLRSIILRMCSTLTGHSSWQAPQVVQAQISSSVTTSPIIVLARPSEDDSALPASNPGPASSKCSFKFRITSLGERVLPLSWAGQLAWHRPHTAQE
ncbi:hypothetical protein ES703_112997 [subsurface metagenome]